MVNVKYDWQWPREYYARSQCLKKTSLKEVARIFNVPYQSLRRVAAIEEWQGHVFICSNLGLIEHFETVQQQDIFADIAYDLFRRNYDRLDEINSIRYRDIFVEVDRKTARRELFSRLEREFIEYYQHDF